MSEVNKVCLSSLTHKHSIALNRAVVNPVAVVFMPQVLWALKVRLQEHDQRRVPEQTSLNKSS